MRHAFVIWYSRVEKSCFGKNQSFEGLTPDGQYTFKFVVIVLSMYAN